MNQDPESKGAVYHIDTSLGDDIRRVSTEVIHDAGYLKAAGRRMTAALVEATRANDPQRDDSHGAVR